MRGFIRARGAGYTCYWSVRDPATGKRVQHSKGGFRTRRAAQAHLNTILSAVETGAWRPDQAVTVRQLFLEHWLPAQEARGLRASTMSMYRGAVEWHILPHLGGKRVAALAPADVTAMVEHLRSAPSAKGRRGLSPRTAQAAVGTLKAATKRASTNGLVGRDPLAGLQRPRAKSPEMRFWTATEARAFLEATRDDRLGFAWALALATGLRRGELCGLTWGAIDLEARTLRVERTLVVVDGKVAVSSAKTQAGRRTVPLGEEVVALLRTLRRRQTEERLRAGGAYAEGGALLADELGRPYAPDAVAKKFAEAVRAAGLPRIRFHDLRHSSATLMLAAGTPVRVVSEVLGHANVMVTLQTYGHVVPGMAEQATSALSASLMGRG